MKKIVLFTALTLSSLAHAASTIVDHQEYDNLDGTYETTMKIDTDQTFLSQEILANGTFVSTYEGIADDYFTFDTQGGTREIDQLTFHYGNTMNRYRVHKVGGVEQQGQAMASFYANVRMFNTSNELLYEVNDVNYYNYWYNNAFNPENNFSVATVTTLGLLEKYDFQNTAVIDALSNGGVRFEIDDRVEWSVLGLDGESIATDLQTYADGEFNDYNMFIRAYSSTVPEPSSVALIGLGGLALIVRRKR